MYQPLERTFYIPSAEIVAPQLLGHYLLRSTPEGIFGGIIVETEAYITGDPSCHAFRGPTRRTRAMWDEPGFSYVYFIYGCHFCFNAICREVGAAEAVLVRAIEPAVGLDIMRSNRNVPRERDLTNGPGKLCAAMAIGREQDGIDICDANSPLFIAQNPGQSTLLDERGPVIHTTRIGINVAADWPLRWYLGGSAFVSKK